MHEQLRHLFIWETDRVQHDQPVNAVRRNKNVFPDDLQRRPFVSEFLRLHIEISCSHGPVGRPDRLATSIGHDRPQAGGYSARVWIVTGEADVIR